MNKNYIHIIICLWCGLIWANPANSSLETSLEFSKGPFVVSKDSLNPTKKDSTKTKKVDKAHLAHLQQMAALRQQSGLAWTIGLATEFNTSKENDKAIGIVEKTFRSFPTLDEKIIENNNFNVSFANRKPEFTPEFIKSNFDNNPKADTLVAKAIRAFEAVQELGNFVDIITGNELLELPVGLSKKDSTSGNSVQLAITQVKFTPQYAEFKAWGKLTIPQKGENGAAERDLFFGAEGIKLSHDGALVGDMRLVLLGDQAIPINGDNWLLTLKGGVNLKTDGAFSDQSYVEFDCSGLKSISLEGDVRVSRNVLLPIDNDGNYVCGDSKDTQFQKDKDNVIDNKCYVGASFNIKANGWNDLLMEVNLPRFEVQGLKGWGFNLENVVMDLSDSRSSPNLVLPQDYNSIYPDGDRKLWRGFYAQEVSVMLPKGIEDTKKSSGRVEFSAQNLVLDSQGVSGTFFAENVLQSGDGAAGKWAFTIEDVSISLSRNSLTGGSLGGDIAVPIFEEPMDYAGYIHQNGYGLEVGLQSEYTAPVFLGEMQLERNSSVAIHVKDGNVYPYANLTGKLAIAGKINQKPDEKPDPEDKNGFGFNGISFQELELQTEPGKKAIQAKSFGFNGEMKLMNFPASIANLALVTPDNQVGLAFDLKINLDDSGSHAATSLQILGRLENGAKIQEWKFEKVKVTGIAIDYTKGNFNIKGGLKVMEDDPTYGDGFSGELTATFNELNFSATGRAMFGKTDFRYWFVDIWSDTKKGSQSKFLISSFVGGVSNRMRKASGNSDGWSPGSAVYVPDSDTGLGVRAGVKIGTENSSTFQAKAYLEMEYNIHGGLNRIGFMGEGAMMGDSGGSSSSSNADFGALNKTFEKVNDFYEKNKDKVEQLAKHGNFLGLSKEAIPVHDVAASGKIGVYVGIEKDFVNQSFKGEFELYLDLEGVKGGGENNLAGYASILTSPTDWHIYIGTPQKRIELLFDLTPVQIRVGGYFMTGTDLPTQLDPHPRVVQILGRDMLNGNRKDNQLITGKGFAFGLNFAYGYGFEKLIFYANVELGAGFDVMHAYYPNAKCKGRPGPVGNDGWYSMGQVYAYLYGEFGIKVDLAFIKGKFPIAEAGVAAMLRGQFPNPVYFSGYVGMYYKILGGLVEGRMRLKVDFGEECEFVGINNAVGVPIISDITPTDNSDDVSVFAAPQAVFNYAANKDFTVDLDEGPRTFKIQLNNFTVTSEGRELAGELEWNDTNDALTFKPVETLPSEKQVKIIVEVSFDEKIGGSYQTMTEDGKPVIEKRESTFMTDKAPDYIVWEKIAYIYPVKDQKAFYPEEYKTGYLKMQQPQNYLFNKGYEIRAEFVSKATGQGQRTNLWYEQSKGTVFFDIPDMVLNADYVMNIMVFPPGQNVETEIIIEQTEVLVDSEAGDTNWYDPTTDTQSEQNTSGSAVVSNKKAANVTISNGAPKSILDYEFRTSKHPSFDDKIRSLDVTNNITNIVLEYDEKLQVVSDLHSLSIKVSDYEHFDEMELFGDRYTQSQPLVYAEAVLKDNYYKNKIGPLLYNTGIYPIDGSIRVSREENLLGIPPVRSLYIAQEYMNQLENNPSSSWVKNRIPFVYHLPYQYKTDMFDVREQLVSRYVDRPSTNLDKYQKLLEEPFPPLPLGRYKTNLIYKTPGNLYKKGYEIEYRND